MQTPCPGVAELPPGRTGLLPLPVFPDTPLPRPFHSRLVSCWLNSWLCGRPLLVSASRSSADEAGLPDGWPAWLGLGLPYRDPSLVVATRLSGKTATRHWWTEQ